MQDNKCGMCNKEIDKKYANKQRHYLSKICRDCRIILHKKVGNRFKKGELITNYMNLYKVIEPSIIEGNIIYVKVCDNSTGEISKIEDINLFEINQ